MKGCASHGSRRPNSLRPQAPTARIFRLRSLRARGTGPPPGLAWPLGMTACALAIPALHGPDKISLERGSYCIADVQGVLMNEQRRGVAGDTLDAVCARSLSAQEAGSKRSAVCQKRHPYPSVGRADDFGVLVKPGLEDVVRVKRN